MSVTDADRKAAKPIALKVMISELTHEDLHNAFAAHRTRAHAEGYEAAVRDVVAWLRDAKQDGYLCICNTKFADAIERGEFKP